jgi:hypothetical protein
MNRHTRERERERERGREMEAVNTVVGLWINCLHHKSIITVVVVVVVVGVLQEYFQFSTAKCELHRCSVCDPEKENGMKKS